MRLVTGLRPDPLSELTALSSPLVGLKGQGMDKWGVEREGEMEGSAQCLRSVDACVAQWCQSAQRRTRAKTEVAASASPVRRSCRTSE